MQSNFTPDRRIFSNRIFAVVQEYIDADAPAEHVLAINLKSLEVKWLPREDANNNNIYNVYELDELIYADESGIIEPDDESINNVVRQYFN